MKIKKNLLVTLALLIHASTCCLGQYAPSTGRSAGLGGIGATIEDVRSVQSNPAGPARVEQLQICMSNSLPHLVPGIQASGIAMAMPIARVGVFGALVTSWGAQQYRETGLSICYSRALQQNIQVGLRLGTNILHIKGYGSSAGIDFGAGYIHRIGQSLALGAVVYMAKYFVDNEVLHQEVRITSGVKYEISQQTSIHVELQSQSYNSLIFRLGIEQQFLNDLVLRFGANGRPVSVHFGMGIPVGRKISIDIAVGYHVILGITPTLSVIYLN